MQRAVSYLIAVVALGAWLAMFAAVAAFVAWVWPSVIGLAVAAVLGVVLIYSRPRLPKLEADVMIASPANFPLLHIELAAISSEMQAKPPAVFAFSSGFDAYTTRTGLRRRHTIVVGMLLWEFLEPDEQRAVVAHELAHEVNGDLRRGLLIGSSIDLLHGWIDLLHPGPWAVVRDADVVDMAVWVLMRVAVVPIDLLARLQRKLTLAQSREAEFRADELAHGVIGDGMASALDKLRFKTSVEFGLQVAVRQNERPLLSAGRRRLDQLTADQLAAIRGAEAHTAHAVDSTHPPTTARIQALQTGCSVGRGGALQLSGWQRVESEMGPVREHMEAALERSVLESLQG